MRVIGANTISERDDERFKTMCRVACDSAEVPARARIETEAERRGGVERVKASIAQGVPSNCRSDNARSTEGSARNQLRSRTSAVTDETQRSYHGAGERKRREGT